MKPVIAHPPDKPEMACLIDLHSTAYTYANGIEGVKLSLLPGKVGHLALKAVAIHRLRAGEFANIDGTEYPAPCQAVATSVWQVKDPMHRGIYPDAAVALLTMNHGLKNAISPGKEFHLSKDAPGFNKWHFAIAWTWSAWQAKHRQGDLWTLERRWRELQNLLQYPD